jgi:hypothetical protein
MKSHHSYELEVAPGKALRHFTAEEALEWTQRWIDVYAQNAQGTNIRAYLWHIFSAGRYSSVCGKEARDLYLQQIATEIVVLSNDRSSALLTNALPGHCNAQDFYVFPTNLAWTMAFTHEDGWLGPYFATHSNYGLLVAQDIERCRAAQRKAEELERAKQKGWV